MGVETADGTDADDVDGFTRLRAKGGERGLLTRRGQGMSVILRGWFYKAAESATLGERHSRLPTQFVEKELRGQRRAPQVRLVLSVVVDY